jgi:hypothetical protein
MNPNPTIGQRREELMQMPFRKLRKLFWRVKREYGGPTDWADGRKRTDMTQAIINYEIGIGGRMG